MPESAKVLRFPVRATPTLTALEVLRLANSYLASCRAEGSEERRLELLQAPDVLLSVCTLLYDKVENSAAEVFEEASALYRAVTDHKGSLGVFDEKDFFLGQLAAIAGGASRIMGKRSDAEVWFERAEAGYRHTVNPAPLLASVSYQRLALRCEAGQFAAVAELAPMLARSFEKLNMPRDYAKCTFLEALSLKLAGNHDKAECRFAVVTANDFADLDPGLAGLAYVHMADMYAADEKNELAEAAYSHALPLLARGNRRPAIAQLKGTIAETFRRQGRLNEAIGAYNEAVAEYSNLGMTTTVAYFRILLAQSYLEAGQHRQAEWQILTALPIIEEAQMVPEGFAAVALLRESVRQRNANPQALSDLRQYLQASN